MADREYTLVFDGTKADGDLETVRITANKTGETAEYKLQKISEYLYLVAKQPFLLPDRTDVIVMHLPCRLFKNDNHTQIQLARSLKAECDFAGKKEDVVIIDYSFNGKFDDQGIIYYDKDGYPLPPRFDMRTQDRSHLADWVFFPNQDFTVNLGQPFMMNGVLWTITVVGNQIVPQLHDCKMGEIRWKGDDMLNPSLSIESKSSLAINKLNAKGRWLLPVGEYRLLGFAYTQGGGRISCGIWTGYKPKAKTLTVGTDNPLELEPVTEAVAKIVATPMTPNREISFSLKMVTPNDDGVIFISNDILNQDTKPKPGVRILDAADKEILNERFKYTNYGNYTWKVPLDLQGEFTVEPILTEEKLPFKVTIEKTKITL
jgi:hypothetical protein